MLYHPPKLPYNGVTIILSKPSRFDTNTLISGNVGNWFEKILAPFSRLNFDIRLAEDNRPLLHGTKMLLLLGEEALWKYKPGSSLLLQRGAPFITSEGLIALASIYPQDCYDRIDYEKGDEETDNEKETEKDRQKTSRKNFKFWFYADVRKAIRILEKGIEKYPVCEYRFCPQPDTIINHIQGWKGGFLCVDIETDPAQNITVFSLLFSSTKELNYETIYEVWTIPFLQYDNSLLYSKLDYCHIFRALSYAFQRNTVVGHNLSFDLFIFLYKYFVPLPLQVHDTMVGHHRCHPEIEKSLAHVISYYTDLPYHKDEGVFRPRNVTQERQLWEYNAKDVWTTWLVFCAQQKEIDKLGARQSVEQGCGMIRPLLKTQYDGALCDTKAWITLVENATKNYEQITRVLKLMTKGLLQNPRSTDQVSDYLFKTLGLPIPVVKKKIKKKTNGKENGPTGKESLYKLYLKYPLPSIRLIMEAKRISKEGSGWRNVRLWRGDKLTCAYSLTTETFRLKSRELLSFSLSKDLL